jgi:hypothetical protein
MGEQEKPQDWKIRQYYQQEELVEKIVELCQYREIAPTYPQGYGKRPDAINFPGDFTQLVEDGAIAFHASVEHWRNPLLIDKVSNLNDLRTGWDLVIDIDCDHSFELSKEVAQLVIQEIQHHGIDHISVKFSGNRGFHIGVRQEAFPEEAEETELADHYPELPRGIIDYIRENIRDEVEKLVKEYGFEEEIQTDEGVDPFQVADVENDWGQRHLFRMPYSINDKSWLVSKPIKIEEIPNFEKEDAKIDNIDFESGFLDSYEEDEARNLVVQALDFIEERRQEKHEKRIKNEEKDFDRPEEAIPEKYFPPTINNILEGLEDGRKRALFILINFFRTIGYSWEEVESKIWKWNEENKEELRESYVKGQLNWHKKRGETVPPPNYDSKGYYKDMQVYEGDNLEEKVPNPVSYAFRKANRGGDDSNSDKGSDNSVQCPYCGKEYSDENQWYKKHVRSCNNDEDKKVRKIE